MGPGFVQQFSLCFALVGFVLSSVSLVEGEDNVANLAEQLRKMKKNQRQRDVVHQ